MLNKEIGMKLSRLRWVGTGAVICSLVTLGTIEGCSGDDNNGDAGDSGNDGTSDTGKDINTQDVKNDVNEGGPTDAGPDVTEIVAFQHAISSAFCQRLGSCCYSTQLDAAAPDAAVASCIALVESPNGGGFENVVGDLADPLSLNSGHIVVDETAKTSCLAGLATMTCGSMTGTEYETLAKNCVGALHGSQAVGQNCRRTVECNNAFCSWGDAGSLAPDASGTCVPLSGSGGDCDPRGNGNDQCMYRSWGGTTPLRCDTVEGVPNTCGTTGNPTFKCTPKLANGTGCYYEWECQGACGGNNCTCQSATTAVPFPYDTVCPSYFGADSGLQ